MSTPQDPPTTEPAGDAKEPPAAPVQQPADNQPSQEEPFAVFHTKEQFEERLSRKARAKAAELLGVSPEEAKKALEAYKELQTKEEERRKQEMSELERMQAEKVELESRLKAEQERAEQAAFDLVITRACAERGIKDTDYAKHLILRKANTLGDEDELDEGAFLDEQLKDARVRIALGVDELPENQAPKQIPANTSPTGGAPPGSAGGPPKQQEPGGSANGKTAMEMDKSEFASHLSKLGVSL